MIERFTKSKFEEVLPVNKNTAEKLWTLEGFQGEFYYSVKVSPNVKIFIWSSIGGNGIADGLGKNSIRCYLADPQGKPLSNKSKCYITRVKGWETRLIETLRTLWEMGKKITPSCVCGGNKSILWCKQGLNKGRRFTKCSKCDKFEWVDPIKKAA